MKIAQVITRLEPGGTWPVVTTLLDRLAARGDEVHLALGPCISTRETVEAFCRKHRIHLRWVPEFQRAIHPWKDWQAYQTVAKWLNHLRPDIVHTHTSKAGLVGRLAAHRAGVPKIIHSTHGQVFSGYFNAFTSNLIVLAERQAAKWCEIIVVLSHAEIHEHLSRRVGQNDQYRVIPNGVEPSKYLKSDEVRNQLRTEANLTPDQCLLAMVGRMTPVKGHKILLHSLKIICAQEPSVRVWMVGEGECRPELERLAVRLGIDQYIRWWGYRENIPAMLQAIDLLIMPSLNEGFGLSAVEAMASGCPVVGSRVGGIPEVIQEKETGWLVPPQDPSALAEAILQGVRHPSERRRMGEKARERVKQEFTLDRMVDETLKCYET